MVPPDHTEMQSLAHKILVFIANTKILVCFFYVKSVYFVTSIFAKPQL